MRRVIKTLLLSTVAALALLFTLPSSSDAVDVTPVNNRHYYRHHYTPYHGYYGHWYRHPGYYYYGRPGVQVYRYPHRYYDNYYYHPHGGVAVGPFRFEVWH